jgi:uncharacterized protein YlzI (FlbEa/FlbD family)
MDAGNAGILYVVFNEWIRNPETNEKPYKIGITRKSVDDRYYGLGLIMPGEFKTLFAYKFENCAKAEQLIHDILIKKRVNGEWFNLNQKELDHIKATCELMVGILVTDEVQDGINGVGELVKNPAVKAWETRRRREKIRQDYKKYGLGFNMRNGKQLTVYKLDNGEVIEVIRDMADRDWNKGIAALEEYLKNREI